MTNPLSIHHDIKSDNILVSLSTGTSKFDVTFKLADLGLTEFVTVVKRGEEVDSRDAHGTQTYSRSHTLTTNRCVLIVYRCP